MPTSKNIENYPEWMFRIVNEFKSGAKQIEVPLVSRGQAIHYRQKFYAFRGLLEEPTLRAVANKLVVQLTGEGGTTLRFSDMDSTAPKILITHRISPDIPEHLPKGATFNFEPGDGSIEVHEPHDATEDVITKLYTVPKAPCEHEPDTTNTFCLKCKEPL